MQHDKKRRLDGGTKQKQTKENQVFPQVCREDLPSRMITMSAIQGMREVIWEEREEGEEGEEGPSICERG